MKSVKFVLFSIIPAILLFTIIEVAARFYWDHLEKQVTSAVLANGEKVLRNDAINFIKQPDEVLGYRLRQNLEGWSNSKGFAQKDEVEESRADGSLRIMAIGESTTQGTGLTNSYPYYLSKILQANAKGYNGKPEIINAGVSGWVSDQWTIYSVTELYRYSPDVVIIYGGWNDFQSYDPFKGPPAVSYFKSRYGGLLPASVGYLRSVTLASAGLEKYFPNLHELLKDKDKIQNGKVNKSIYHILFENISRTIEAFRAYNPNVKIVLSSLVSRWPMDTEDQFNSELGHIWWMPINNISHNQAAHYLDNLNKELRDFAIEKGLIFFDMAKVFNNLDRQQLMTDFAHMTPEGYQIMAVAFYSELNNLGVVNGASNTEYDYLQQEYMIGNFKSHGMNENKYAD